MGANITAVARSPTDSPAPKRLVRATNRRARHDYAIGDTIEVGLALAGSEVKSLRTSTPTLTEGFARIRNDELWLLGVYIPPLPQAASFGHEPVRPRKCLVRKRELRKLKYQLEAKGMTLVPLSLYFLGSWVKVELGLGKGRAKGDKRQRDREKSDRKAMRRYER